MVALLAGMLVLLGVFLGGRAVAGEPAPATAVATRTVGAGDTLWEIAADLAGPGQDVRDVVSQIVDLNGLAGADIRAGQQLLVPVAQP